MSAIEKKIKGIEGQTSGKTGEDFKKKLMEGSAKDIGNRMKNTDASFHDRGAIDSYLKQVEDAIGEKWNYKQYYGENGGKSIHPYFDAEVGDLVFPDKDGKVRYVNKDYLMKMQQIEDYIDDKVDYMMKIAIKSDQLCMDVLNLSKEDYKKVLLPVGPNKGDDTLQGNLGMDDDMKKLDGTVQSIKATPAGSAKQVEKLSKLRIAVRAMRDRFVMKDLHRDLEEARKKAGPVSGNNEMVNDKVSALNRTTKMGTTQPSQ